ncbi:sensor histidine kinase [Azohydromonas sediminis]|uniref:sensor histidine kinase n=1 Tax=Azohydromonas sediminis TaxID=2259674 RepID=UPI000E64DB2E|nr:HAMP domain-containing sensor histidine kinase [Azohydromonas sediminis]
MWPRLHYRQQIPLGLSLAVLLTALLTVLLAAPLTARSARAETMARLERAATLIDAQALPLLATEDVYRVFRLLDDTVALLPGASARQARAAVLDTEGRVFAASDPRAQPIGLRVLGAAHAGPGGTRPAELTRRTSWTRPGGGVAQVDPIRSEDGQLLGYTYIEVDAPVFAPGWQRLAAPAALGGLLAVVVLAPVGWQLGARMARPVGQIARVIEDLTQGDGTTTRRALPASTDPELARIAAAVDHLIAANAARERAARRALSAERLAAVGRLTGAIAHEINNPLGGLLNAVQTLRLHGDDAAIRTRTLDLLARGLQQIRATVAALLPQARVEDRALTANDLDDVLLLAGPAAARAGVELSARDDLLMPPRVPSAPMRQAMLNMLLNAVKAAGSGGRVQARLAADAERVSFCVTNTGAALSAEALARVLETEGGDDPRGFGLWVCRELALLHGGGFELDPAERAGTRLVFWLPNRETT